MADHQVTTRRNSTVEEAIVQPLRVDPAQGRSDSMDYDLIIIGGGLAGAALGRALAPHGVRVLIIEREKHFRDRVRGEGVHPWGVAEARALDIYDLLLATGGKELRWMRGSEVGEPGVWERDLIATTPTQAGEMTFYHPAMQETLLQAATDAGAVVRRGVRAVGLAPGAAPRVHVQAEGDGGTETISARLVVVADGRDSQARSWAGFTVNRDPEQLLTAGFLLAGLNLPDDAMRMVSHMAAGHYALFFPLRDGRHRVYYIYNRARGIRPLSGLGHTSDFFAACVAAGADPDWFDNAQPAGPLATFDGADRWVDRPYRDGVALVGDAAAACNPCWGCGMGLTLHDVRTLRDLLLESDDWDAAGRSYAAEHDRFYGNLHRLEKWRLSLCEIGPQADARRARVYAKLAAAAPGSAPNLTTLGPDWASDEAILRNFV